MHTCTHAHMHTRIHTHTRTLAHTHAHTRTHTHTHTHTHAHTHIHTHMDTHTHTRTHLPEPFTTSITASSNSGRMTNSPSDVLLEVCALEGRNSVEVVLQYVAVYCTVLHSSICVD